MSSAVAVIGGGISGVQASLDLANAGVEVFLIERSPSLGGHMAQLDKTFPTNDCSTCILSPKLVEASRHPMIHLMTLSEVIELEGECPEFRLTVRHHPRYVSEECIGCGSCSDKCPVEVDNEFDLGLGSRKAIDVPFDQAVPLRYSIDRRHCLMLTKGKCGVCDDICPVDAINYSMESEDEVLEVGAVIVATGFDQMDPSVFTQYCYESPNVITAIQLERILSPSGPTEGRLRRRDNGEVPESILFVQCVGSRDSRYCEHCSRFCCMSSLKEALVAMEHEERLGDVTVCYIDLRTFGKGFDDYRQQAVEEGVALIRGKVAKIVLSGENLEVRVEDVDCGQVRRLEEEMVVLAMAAVPSEGTQELAQRLGIELGADGFFRSTGGVLHTTRDGVFLAGCCSGPKDIPDSVCEGSSAASEAISLISERKTRKEKRVPSEGGGAPRIGVFVCKCGTNIASVIDVEGVVSASKNMPGVTYAETNLFSCSESSLDRISQKIEEEELNRVVVASCSPRTHEQVFRNAVESAGVNPFLLEMVNIRDQCSWVHKDQKEEATRKTIDLVRMGVAKAAMLRPLEPIRSQIERRALVIGGGPAGLTAAIDIATHGYDVYLVEKEEKIGGTSELDSSGEQYDRLKDEVEGMNNIQISTGTEIKGIEGSVGNFGVSISDGGEFAVGAIVVATGGREADYEISDYCASDSDGLLISSSELEERIERGGEVPEKVSFVQCVGVRNDRYGCSRFCCTKTLEQAVRLREMGKEVSVFYTDMMSFKRGAEELYKKAGRKGVVFYPVAEAPHLRDGFLLVNSKTDGLLRLKTDMVVMATGMVPGASNEEMSKMLKVPLTEGGFFMERHPKLAPVEFSVDGVYLAGSAQYPKDMEEAMVQGGAVAAKVTGLFSQRELVSSPFICEVDETKCRGCGECESICSYGAAVLEETEGRRVSHIDSLLCKGCGTCAVGCPSNAITANGFTLEQLEEEIDALLGGA